MKKTPSAFAQIPPGGNVADFVPQFKYVVNEVGPIGKPSKVCACCRRLFTPARQPGFQLKVYPANLSIPICFLYQICRGCGSRYRRSNKGRDAVMSAVEKFHFGEE